MEKKKYSISSRHEPINWLYKIEFWRRKNPIAWSAHNHFNHGFSTFIAFHKRKRFQLRLGKRKKNQLFWFNRCTWCILLGWHHSFNKNAPTLKKVVLSQTHTLIHVQRTQVPCTCWCHLWIQYISIEIKPSVYRHTGDLTTHKNCNKR